MLKRIIWVLTIIWMAIIFYFSHQPAEVSRQNSGEILVKMNMIKEEQIDNTDWSVLRLQIIIRKWAHFIEYFVLGILMTLSVLSFNNCKLLTADCKSKYLLSWFLCTLYAVSDEIHQYFVPGRGPGIKDVILDSISSLTAIALLLIITKILRLSNKNETINFKL